MHLPTSHITIRRDIADLLRREQAYQRAQLRRLIQRQPVKTMTYLETQRTERWINLDALLKAMNRRTK